MNFSFLLENVTNPALLFFVLGIIAHLLKSDLEIPANTSKFISLYLLFAIGFKGGQELSHEQFTAEVLWTMVAGIAMSILIPLYTFFLLRKKLGVYNAGAIAAAYGSVSAVTFVTGVTYLESNQLHLQGHMLAIMAMMESPAIIMGLLLISFFNKDTQATMSKRNAIKHCLTNGSVLLIMGSLCIGYIADVRQAEGIKPFTNDLFKGFLSIFLLDMGIVSARKLKDFFAAGLTPLIFAIVVPLFNGIAVAIASQWITTDVSNRFILSLLAASASYIAVPAAMKISVPKANPGLFLPMALAVTFPVNITVGMPLYYFIIEAYG